MSKETQKSELGMVGLGVMGRNLVLNIADHGFSVAGYDKDLAKVKALNQEAEKRDVHGATEIEAFIALLRSPRAIMMLVPAGPPVDSVIKDLLPHLDKGDLIIDAGNSYFKDTDVRARDLTKKGVHFLGMGVSGGEEGARHGPSIMPGGPKEAYERVRPILEAAAAKVDGDPCVTWLGPGSAGHYVKMVHNGIEYGIMQLIAETYDLMKRGLDMDDDEIGDTYALWNKGELNSYLVEITSKIFPWPDEKTGKRLIDEIVGVAQAKRHRFVDFAERDGTAGADPDDRSRGRACGTCLSFTKEREQASAIYNIGKKELAEDHKAFLKQLAGALYAGMIITYAQGMALLAVASVKYKYHLDLEAVARIWRGGCIIRAALLEDICAAFRARRDLPNLTLDSNLSGKVMTHQEDLRQVVSQAAESGIPAPGLYGFVRLSRRLSQRLAAGQSYPGSARLFRRAHL